MKLDKKNCEYREEAGIALVMALITGWLLDSILILGVLLGAGLLFGLFAEDEEGL